MSLCRLYSTQSLGTRPVNWRWIPRERYAFGLITRASGGRSTTRRERNQSSRSGDDGESDGLGSNPLWDSNVENVRRRNRNRPEDREASSQTISTPDWLTPKKEWTFNSEENKSEEKRNKREEEFSWWKSSKVGDEYEESESGSEEDGDDDDDDDEEFDYSSRFLGTIGITESDYCIYPNMAHLEQLVQDQLFSSLRWGIPVSIVVLPWLLGNPVILLLGLAAVPAVQRAIGPVLSEVWRAFLDLSGSPKRRRRANTYDPTSDEGENAYSSWGVERDNGQTYRSKKSASAESNDNNPAEAFPYSDVGSSINSQNGHRSRKAGPSVSMGGWEDLEADKRGRMPVRRSKKSSKLGWRSRRKEKPLFLRLLVALFPFLRNWGGWLSVFLFFPFLSVLEGSLFT